VDGDADVTVGVWERGAGETLSSGTSAVAVASAAVTRGWCQSPVTVHLTGGRLVVELDGDAARLTGPAQEICTVELSPELEL
jgi:diaminopimelate epimerase